MAPKGKKASQKVEEETQAPAVNWPPFQPILPTEDLSLDHLLEGQISTISGLWTSTLCKTYTNFLSSLPLITTPGQPKKGHAVRVNDRFQIEDPAFAERLWSGTGLKELLTGPQSQLTEDEQVRLWGGKVLGLNPNIRIYRYKKGQFFAQHYDDSNLVSIGTPATRARTTWTLLLYLTSPATGCTGGETVFYPESPMFGRKKSATMAPSPEPVVVGLETGMALLHKHGKDCMLHEGREVTAGEKWVIRSDLCVAMT
jgi:hypothetical protein